MTKTTPFTIKRIDQFVHTLQYGDAISGEALTIRRLLREMGYSSDIFSVHTHEKLEGIPLHIRQFREEESGHAVLLHYSITSPFNSVFSSLASAHRTLVYHNLTPLEWYAGYNSRVTSDLVKGREELPELLKLSDLVLADSSFNAHEAKEMGAHTVEILPLPLDPDRWEKPANPGILAALKGHGGRNLLHVGRFAPNKCLEDIIKAFYFYHHKFDKNSKLWLVGSDTDTEIYSFELRKLAQELRLKDAVEFVGSVSDDELKGFFEGSDVYICMSEHEGFCVPLIEALHFRLPVIAYSSSAIPETVGTGGLLVDRKDPLYTGMLIHDLLHNSHHKHAIIEAGLQHIEKYSIETFKTSLKEKLISRLALDQQAA
jgi:L-malate glycosyltransferase